MRSNNYNIGPFTVSLRTSAYGEVKTQKFTLGGAVIYEKTMRVDDREMTHDRCAYYLRELLRKWLKETNYSENLND